MLMRTDPFNELDRLAQQLFEAGTASRPTVIPMDAWREGDAVLVELDVPGVPAEKLDVDVERNVLTVRAERPAPGNGGVEVLAAERPAGLFSRQLVLGEDLDPDRIEAACHDGVLRVRIPVAATAGPRRVEVSPASEDKTALVS